MSFAITAVVASTVISAVSADRAATKSNRAFRDSANAAIGVNEAQYAQDRADWSAWREMGEGAVGRMTAAMSGDQSAFTESAGYQFVRGEGMRDNMNYTSVGGGGGNAMKALADYTTGLASTEYGNWFNRNLQMSSQGMTAVAGTQAAGARSTNNISDIHMREAGVRSRNARDRVEGVGNALNEGISNELYRRGGTRVSDRRLKTDIKRIGSVKGYPWYSFKYIWGERSQGVMSDEIPKQFVQRLHGYDVVDYGALLGAQ